MATGEIELDGELDRLLVLRQGDAATPAQGDKADTAIQQATLDAAIATRATAAQGAKADSALQSGDLDAYATDSELAAGLDGKVDKSAGLALSQNSYTDAEKTKLGSIASGAQVNYAAISQAEAEGGTATNLLSWTAQRVRQAIVAWWAATADKTKLDGMAVGATANATNAELRDRATHTGVQAISTITNLQTSLDAKAARRAAINPQSAAYTLALTDDVVTHPATDTAARTWTIPANSSVPFPVGTIITLDNRAGAGAITLAINTDTLELVGAGTVGSRTIAAGGQATLLKVEATVWRVGGVGVT